MNGAGRAHMARQRQRFEAAVADLPPAVPDTEGEQPGEQPDVDVDQAAGEPPP